MSVIPVKSNDTGVNFNLLFFARELNLPLFRVEDVAGRLTRDTFRNSSSGVNFSSASSPSFSSFTRSGFL